MKNTLDYPHLARYYHLTDYLDPTTGRFNKVPSQHAGSDASIVNKILANIERGSGVYAYINNRIKEAIAVSMLRTLLDTEDVHLAGVVNDIAYGVDIVAKIGDTYRAIDLTTNPHSVMDKLVKNTGRDGQKKLLSPSGTEIYLPFIVLYMADYFHRSVATILEKNAEEKVLSKDCEKDRTMSAIETVLTDSLIARMRPEEVLFPHTTNILKPTSEIIVETFLQKVRSKLTLPENRE